MFISLFPVACRLLIGLVSIVFIGLLFTSVKRWRLLPPGPWGLPIIGYLPFLSKHFYLQLDSLAKKYGPVFSLKLGTREVVVIADWTHLKLAFANESLLARPKQSLFPGIIEELSFAEMSGDAWRQHRRLSLHILRDVGFGKSAIENAIKEEIFSLMKSLNTDGKPVDFYQVITPSVGNNVAVLLFGHKVDPNDPLKRELDANVTIVSRGFQFTGVYIFAPWLLNFFIWLKKSDMNLIADFIKKNDQLVQNEIDAHLKGESKQMADYIDGYLQEMENRKLKSDASEDDPLFSLEILKRNAAAFFGAGQGTASSTMMWIVAFLIAHPEHQEKIRNEIAEAIGFERQPDYSDRHQMPFTVAFIYEVHRFGSVVPTNLLRRAATDTKVGDYNIPKDTFVLFNFWSVHRDPELWEKPDEFNPYRFLTENNTKTVKPPYLIPFSAGKRNCPGEALANVELFLYLVCILQKFRVRAEPGSKPITFVECEFGTSRRPKDFPDLIFEPLSHGK